MGLNFKSPEYDMKRYQIIPSVLALYAMVMAYMGRERFFNPSTRTIYLITILAEILVLIALFFFLRRKARLRDSKLKK